MPKKNRALAARNFLWEKKLKTFFLKPKNTMVADWRPPSKEGGGSIELGEEEGTSLLSDS